MLSLDAVSLVLVFVSVAGSSSGRVARLLFLRFTYGSLFPTQLCSLRALRTDILTFAPLTLSWLSETYLPGCQSAQELTSGTKAVRPGHANRLARERRHDLHRQSVERRKGRNGPWAILVSTKPKRMLVTRTPGRPHGQGQGFEIRRHGVPVTSS